MPGEPKSIDRVVASYNDQPCTTLRPADAPVRPGEPCGQIHTLCRGHNAGSFHPERRGDPCLTPALTGLRVCSRHGGQTPQAQAVNRQARAARMVARLGGNTADPVTDPLTELATLAGEIMEMNRTAREMVQEISEQILVDGGDGRPKQLHEYVKLYERSLDRGVKALAEMVKLGLVERQTVVQEQQLEVVAVALGVVFRRMGMDPDLAFGHLAAALREQNALPGTLADVVETTGTRLLAPAVDEVDPDADDVPPAGFDWLDQP